MPGDVGIVFAAPVWPVYSAQTIWQRCQSEEFAIFPLYALDMMIRSLTAAWDSSQNIELALDSRVLLFVLSVKADFAN